jgi:hypothetical protein
MIRRLKIAPELFMSFTPGYKFEVVAEAIPFDAKLVGYGINRDCLHFFIDIESPSFTTTTELCPTFRTLAGVDDAHTH